MDVELHHDALAERTMIDNVAYTILRGHVISTLFPFCVRKTGFPDNLRRRRFFFGAFSRSWFPDFLSNKGIPEFMHAAAGFTSHFGDHPSIHRHDGMVET